MKFVRHHGNTLPHLLLWAKGGFPCLVSTCSAGDRGPAAVLSESPGAASRAESGLVVRGCAYTRGNRELALFAGRSKASYSCSEVVTQITRLGDKNKGLQAQMRACRGTVLQPSACPCLPPSLEHSASGAASSSAPGRWCARGGTGPGVAEFAGASKPPWFVPEQDIAEGQTDLPTLHSYASESPGRKRIQF